MKTACIGHYIKPASEFEFS